MAIKDRSEPATVSSVAARTVVLRLSTLVKVVIVMVLIGLSFYAGFLYGGSGSNPPADAPNSQQRHFAIGLVVYVSPTSITIANEDNTGTSTYGITGSTIISVNGAKASASKIQAGNRVLIRLSRKDPSKADAIIVDTSFSG